MTSWFVAVVCVSLAVGCKGSESTSTDATTQPDGAARCTADQLAAFEQDMAAKLDAAAVKPSVTTDPSFTVMLETADGRRFTHSHGTSTPTTRYESASTSKWVTAVVILDLVDQGLLTLDTRAHDKLPAYWTEAQVDLRDLLSFRSGFTSEPACLNLAGADFDTCVRSIYTANVSPKLAGSEFDYGSAHLQIAGAMAIAAAQKQSWTQLFAAWKAKTGMFPTGVYDVPSLSNPRIASGMHWTGEEYLAFLRALSQGKLLKAATMAELHGNQRASATVGYSPIWDEIHEDWAYALGNWVECPTAKTQGGYNCTGTHRNSSTGAFGAHPFIDADHKYFGLVARQGDLMSAGEGIAIFREIESVAAKWSDGDCN